MIDEREPGSQPLDASAPGCTLSFRVLGKMYQPLSALAILAGLHAKKFTGVCECYLRPDVKDGVYLMGVALGFADEEPDDEWWSALGDDIEYAVAEDDHIRLSYDDCELTNALALRKEMLHAGTAGFDNGAAIWVSPPAGTDPDSPFVFVCRTSR